MASSSVTGYYNGTTNVATINVWRDSSTTSTVKVRIDSTYTTDQGSYKRIYFKIVVDGNIVLEKDTGYKSDFYNYPCKKNSSSEEYKVTISPLSNVYFYMGCGFGHNNITDKTTDDWLYSAIGTPVINKPGVSSIGRTSASSSFSVADSKGASITDNYIDCATGNFSGVVSTITGTSGSFGGLTPNTTYYVRANASNGYYRGYSEVVSFKTTHNNPSIGDVSASHTRASGSLGSTYTTRLSYATSYDYSSYGSHTLEYGTSTSYGSSGSSAGTGGSSAFTMSGLQPNKTYYYRITEKDATGQSTQKTGSFTTPAIAPTLAVNSVSTGVGSLTLTPSASSDTNVSISSITLYYGTSTSYGSSVACSNNTAKTVSNLSHNKTYYYKVIVTDNLGRTAEKIGSAFTKGNAPTISGITVSNILAKTATVKCSVAPDENDKVTSMVLELSDSQNITGTSEGSNKYVFNLTNLSPAKNYSFTITSTTSYSSAVSSSTAFRTLGNGKINGYYVTGGRLNGKNVLGIRLNGKEII